MTRRPWALALAVTLAAPFVLLWPALLPGRALSVADGLLDSYLLAEARPDGHRRANELLTDPYRQFVPWRSFSSTELRAGRIPFWNPHAYAGSPLLGNSQSGVFDPLGLPYLLVHDASRATVWVALLRLAVAGIGALLLARRLGASPAGATLAALAYAWGGFTVAWLQSPHTSSSAWLPFALAATDRVVAEPSARRAALLAIPLALSLLGGHVEVAFFTCAAVSGYALVRHLQDDQRSHVPFRRVVLAVGLAGLLGAAMAAVHVLPFLEALDQSVVVSARTGRADAASLLAGAHPERLVTQVFPYLQGRPLRGEVGFWTPSTVFNDQAATYGSLLGCLLAAAALAGGSRRSPAWALGAVGLAAWFYHVGIPPLRWIGSQLPLLRLSPAERVAPVALCALAVLAGLGLDRLRRQPHGWAGLRTAEKICLTAGVLTTMAGLVLLTAGEWVAALARGLGDSALVRALLQNQADRVLDGLQTAAPLFGLRFLVPWGVIAIGSWLALRRLHRSTDAMAPIAVVFIVAADLFYFGAGFNPSIPVEHAFPETRAVTELRASAAGGRVLVLDEGLPANAATHYRIDDILGYDALDRWRLKRLLGFAGPVGRLSAFPHASSWVHDLLAVRVVARRDKVAPGSLRVDGPLGDGFRLTNLEALPLVFAPARVIAVDGPDAAAVALGTPGFHPSHTAVVESATHSEAAVLVVPARVSRPEPARLRAELEAASPGFVVISEGYDPGWSATIDGAPAAVHPADLAVMAVSIPAGRHALELRFRPRTWLLAVVLSGLAIACVAVLLASAVRRRA